MRWPPRFKSQPYSLKDDKSRWELCKDVAALANVGGGCLVIGIETKTTEDREEEVASAVKPFPFPSEHARLKQHRDALDAGSGVYPVLRNVEILKFDRSPDRALVLIVVPPQADDDLPFLVVRMVEGDAKRGVGVGVPFRSGSHTYWEPAGQIHRDLSDGRRLRSVLAANGVEARAISEPPPPTLRELTDVRLAQIEQFMGWTDAATLLLASVPVKQQYSPIQGFDDRIRKAIERPPEIRQPGFALVYPDSAANIGGSLVNATADRSLLWVDPDGKAFAGGTGTQRFLTRFGGTRVATTPELLAINRTVLVEWTYLFCLLVRNILAPSVSGPWRMSVRLRGAKARPWRMSLFSWRDMEARPDQIGEFPHDDDMFAELDATLDPENDAFSLLSRVYGFFGVSADMIPYAKGGRVVPEMIRAIH